MMEIGKRQEAYLYIKRKIIEGGLQPLSDVSEEELQAELNISRTPIRQALQQLSEEGFVHIYPRKGTIVADIPLDMVHWLYEIRELNEPYITERACGNLSEEWLSDIKQRFMAFKENKGFQDSKVRRYYIELDKELHTVILQTCRNRFLRNAMENVYDHSHWLRVRISMANKEYDGSIEEHLQIIEALLAQDAEKAREAALHHIELSKKMTFKYYH